MQNADNAGRVSLVTAAAALVILVLLGFVMHVMAGILQPLFIAVALCYLIRPASRFIIRYRVPKALALPAVFVLAMVLIMGLGWIVKAHVEAFRDRAGEYQHRVTANVQRAADSVASLHPRLEAKLGNLSIQDQLADQIDLRRIANLALVGVGTAVSWAATVFLVLVYLMFLLVEVEHFPQRIRGAYPTDRAEEILRVVEKINDGIYRYVSVKVLMSLLVAIISLAIMLVFGLDFLVLWALLLFLFNFIPYIGSVIACAFPILTGFLQFERVWPALLLAALLIAAQLVVGNIFEPRLAGRRLGLSPVIVLLSLAFWGWLWGVLGMVLSVPIVVAAKIVMENVPATRPVAALIGDVSGEDEPLLRGTK